MGLMKSLDERNLFLTGTVMSNRLSKNIRLPTNSPAFRQMNRGDYMKFNVRMKRNDGSFTYGGLVVWKDRKMVYYLSNDSGNDETDYCMRRGQGGLIRIPRPISIAQYNKYMGGVDLADMRRLHCNSAIMNQNRWWLKLFFYLLDVSTSNAHAPYNESWKARKTKLDPMNIVQFKLKLIESLVGGRAGIDDSQPDVEHVAVRNENGAKLRYAYCSLQSTKKDKNSLQRLRCSTLFNRLWNKEPRLHYFCTPDARVAPGCD